MLVITILMISSGAQATELGNGLLGVARYGSSMLPSEPELVSAIANSAGVGVDVVPFKDTAVTEDEKYWYRVGARNDAGGSLYSKVIRVHKTSTVMS